MDGCPAHYSRIVREYLNEAYPDHWIGRQGPVAWPPRSPDMTPLDYYLWGDMKQKIYSQPINTQAELQARIINCAAGLDPDVIRRATSQITYRANLCLQQHGNHFENLMH